MVYCKRMLRLIPAAGVLCACTALLLLLSSCNVEQGATIEVRSFVSEDIEIRLGRGRPLLTLESGMNNTMWVLFNVTYTAQGITSGETHCRRSFDRDGTRVWEVRYRENGRTR